MRDDVVLLGVEPLSSGQVAQRGLGRPTCNTPHRHRGILHNRDDFHAMSARCGIKAGGAPVATTHCALL